MSVPRSILASALLALALLAGSPQGLTRAAADPVEVTEAPPLTWGFKTSWRTYAPLPETADGAEAGGAGPYQITWPFEAGSYDAATGTTALSYGGSVHWRKYRASELNWPEPPGYEGEPNPFLLDVTLSQPQITISGDRSTVTALAVSRNKITWELIDYGRVPIVDLDVLGVTPTLDGGTTGWEGIPATMAEEGVGAFDGTYVAGTVVDAVDFAYTGPGGAPDFSEHFDAPGSVALELSQNELFVNGSAIVSLDSPSWTDRGNLIVHSSYPEKIGGVNSRRIQAFDLERMEPAGEPWTAPNAEAPLNGGGSRVVAYDTNQNRLLYRANAETGATRWLRWDVAAEQYESGLLTDPQMGEPSFVGANNQGLAWDPTRERGYRVERVVPAGVEPDDHDNHEWQLIVYAEGAGGIWERKTFELPGFGPDHNQHGYAQNHSFADPAYATASDGSLIVLATARTSSEPANPAPATIPAAYRLTIDAGDETVDVQPLPHQVTNSNAAIFTGVQTAPNGHILLSGFSGPALHCRIDAGTVACDPPLDVEGEVEPGAFGVEQFAIDPADGTVWYSADRTRQLVAFRDGELVGGRSFEVLNSRNGPLLVGPDHSVYAQTSDGSPALPVGSRTWGHGRFERLGFAPTVDAQPQPAGAELSAGEDSAAVLFSSNAAGEPAPARQWQVREPGSPRFVDLEGEQAETLAVAAERGMDGTRYRAVYENAAGRVASAEATLSVDYAPSVSVDPASVTVLAGSEAEFSVLADANPEPEIQWQRRVDGFWQPIAASDDNFEIEGAALTVLETNTDQSGALFRAKLVNPVGTAFSRQAKLTVAPPSEIPDGGVDLDRVSLDWTGNAEMQKAPPFGASNYFSAGISAGDEATYSAASGNARVFGVAPGGTEALASYATRAAHVSGASTQLVRLYGGSGRVEEDGSATVEWDASFSVNFYGGLVPFTLSDPRLRVEAGGGGTLRADLSGCASSLADPDQCTPLTPRDDVLVASFAGVEVDPAGVVAPAPEFAGVEVDLPDGTTAQNRSVAGWGAWPQEFVDFHVETGLASYWYTSGSVFDQYKAPHPVLFDFEGERLPEVPALTPAADSVPAAPPLAAPRRGPASRLGAGAIALRARQQKLGGGRRIATVAVLACPAGGERCRVRAPRRVRVQIGKGRFGARVLAPRSVRPGARAKVRVRLPKPAVEVLRGGRRGRLAVRIALRQGDRKTIRTARVQVRG